MTDAAQKVVLGFAVESYVWHRDFGSSGVGDLCRSKTVGAASVGALTWL